MRSSDTSHLPATPPVSQGDGTGQSNPPSYAESTTSTMSAATSVSTDLNPNFLNVKQAVTDLVSSEWYIGNPDLIKNVKWLVRENTFLLVRSDDEAEAEVEFIGEVDSQDSTFNLYIDGGWKPVFQSSFANIRARAHLIKPQRNVWKLAASIWDDQIKGFEAIQQSKATPEAALLNKIVNANNSIVLRHIIFEVKGLNKHLYGTAVGSDNSDDNSDDDSIDETSPFHMKQWKCSTEEGQQELQKIIDEGILKGNVLPAFHAGPGDTLIEPSDYRRCLSGALVHVKAAITFQNLKNKVRNDDSFYAEIREIRVISPPPPPPPSPSKRRVRDALAGKKKKVRQH